MMDWKETARLVMNGVAVSEEGLDRMAEALEQTFQEAFAKGRAAMKKEDIEAAQRLFKNAIDAGGEVVINVKFANELFPGKDLLNDKIAAAFGPGYRVRFSEVDEGNALVVIIEKDVAPPAAES